jgi:hypothetical protein
MTTASQSAELWVTLKELEEYIRDGMVHQMNGATSFGGEDMQPLKEAHLTCERLKPFLSPALYSQASAATHIALSGLNRMLGDMRDAMTAPLPIRQSKLRRAFDDARGSTLGSYRDALRTIEPLLKPEKLLPTSTINISGPVYGQLNVAGSDIHNATMSLRIGDLLAQIEASSASDPEKTEAKSRLKALLSHPLVAAIVGGLAGGIAA